MTLDHNSHPEAEEFSKKSQLNYLKDIAKNLKLKPQHLEVNIIFNE